MQVLSCMLRSTNTIDNFNRNAICVGLEGRQKVEPDVKSTYKVSRRSIRTVRSACKAVGRSIWTIRSARKVVRRSIRTVRSAWKVVRSSIQAVRSAGKVRPKDDLAVLRARQGLGKAEKGGQRDAKPGECR